MMEFTSDAALESQATYKGAVAHAWNGPFRKLTSQLAYQLLLSLIRMGSFEDSVAHP